MQVHRFQNEIAIYLETGETVYLKPDQARALSQAIDDCWTDINNRDFVNSKFKTFRMDIEKC